LSIQTGAQFDLWRATAGPWGQQRGGFGPFHQEKKNGRRFGWCRGGKNNKISEGGGKKKQNKKPPEEGSDRVWPWAPCFSQTRWWAEGMPGFQ